MALPGNCPGCPAIAARKLITGQSRFELLDVVRPADVDVVGGVGDDAELVGEGVAVAGSDDAAAHGDLVVDLLRLGMDARQEPLRSRQPKAILVGGVPVEPPQQICLVLQF